MKLRSSLLLMLAVASASSFSVGCGAKVLDVGSNAKDDPNANAPAGAGDPSNPSGSAAFPASACVALSPTAKLLYVPDPSVAVQRLVPQDDRLWVSGYTDVSGAPVVGQLASVPLHGGAAAPIALDKFDSLAGIFDGNLVYVGTTHQGNSTAADPNVEEVILKNLTTGVSQAVPNPAGTSYVSGVLAHASGIYVQTRAFDSTIPSPISRFATESAAPTQLTSIPNYSSMATDGKDVYYVRWFGNVTEIRIEAVPIGGGAPRILRTYPYDQKFAYSVVAIDDSDVYFTQEATDMGGTIGAGDLRAMKKDGTAERVVATGQKFGAAGFHIDPDYVTWNDQDAQQTIVRVHRAGGAIERIEGQANRWVSAIGVDRCNLYWSVDNPSEVYGRSRLP